MWIQRDFETTWNIVNTQPIAVFVGPRQAGKSSFLSRMGAKGRCVATFDDFAIRQRAQDNPRLFLDELGPHATIDEAQYVPALFPELKRRVDEMKAQRLQGRRRELSYWLTGSNRLLLDRDVSESLTGRASYHRFHGLSAHELTQAFGELTFAQLLARGGWPELWTERHLDPVQYLNDHIQTTLEKDLVLSAGIEKVNEFTRVIRLLAGRVGGLFVASEIARDAGVRSGTVSDWVSFLERMLYVVEVPAFAASRSTRLIKASKYFFLDVGVAVRLQGWAATESIVNSPAVGGLFESLVAAEIVKTRDVYGKTWEISHFRTKEKEELDFIVSDGRSHVGIECKYSSTRASEIKLPAAYEAIKPKATLVVSFDRASITYGALEPISVLDLSSRLLALLT